MSMVMMLMITMLMMTMMISRHEDAFLLATLSDDGSSFVKDSVFFANTCALVWMVCHPRLNRRMNHRDRVNVIAPLMS